MKLICGAKHGPNNFELYLDETLDDGTQASMSILFWCRTFFQREPWPAGERCVDASRG